MENNRRIQSEYHTERRPQRVDICTVDACRSGALQAVAEAEAMAKIIFEKNIEIPMRDGCVLRGDLFRPDSPEKLPVIINRTPYNKSMPMVFALTMDSLRAASAGYNVLIEDCRGRFASDGVFNCFTDEARDGYDTVEWAARQPWSDGNVGM